MTIPWNSFRGETSPRSRKSAEVTYEHMKETKGRDSRTLVEACIDTVRVCTPERLRVTGSDISPFFSSYQLKHPKDPQVSILPTLLSNLL